MSRRQADSAPAFDPFAIATGDNGGPPLDDEPSNDDKPAYLAVFAEINDLYDEAKNWADGEPIDSQEMHDQIEKLFNGLHDLGKKADNLRVDEKKPLDDKVKAVQDRYNPYIQPKKGKVDLAKSSLSTLLAAWRTKVAAQKAAAAAKVAEAAAAAKKAADDTVRSSSGNLAAREVAEDLLKDAKSLERTARRADKAATTGLGLRSVWNVNISDETKALDWAFEHAPGEFMAMALSLAEEQVRKGVRSIEGFSIVEDRVAR